MQDQVVGSSPVKVDAKDKATGATKYPGDLRVPGMLYGKLLYSPSAHAKIIGIGLADAWQVPGVRAVLTANDVPGHNGHGVIIPHQPVMARDLVRSVNDVLVAVAAETMAAAEEALRKVKIELVELPAVFDATAAMAEGAPLVHPEGNILSHHKIRRGDMAEGWARAAAVVENTYRTQMVDHAFLQTEAALAEIDDGGILVLHVATQYPHWDRKELSRALGMPEDMIRVVGGSVGGAFGGREDMSLQVQAALLAMHTGRPVKIVCTREESFHAHSKRHAMVMHYRTGATGEGRLTAVEATIIGDTGAYASWGTNVLRKAAVHATGPYIVPNVKVDAYAVYTNNPFAGAMRGFGAAQPAVAYEGQMDEVARVLGLHPFAVRWQNAMTEGCITATGQVLESGVGLRATMEKAGSLVGWDVSKING
ncbi:MAG: molybdopterin-dependent oxidoreductase [Peptococcaceae bacterium]|nr:molybdopterin-dependent oxidoreductase [Peptococcaceae bacterium]